jgi:hypothetical protein
MKRVAVCAAVLGLLVSPALAGIVVSFDPPITTLSNPGPAVTVKLVANIPQADAIFGWGLDLGVSGPSATYVPPPEIGPLFTAVYAPDGDELAGLVPPPDSVFGAAVVLATLHFNTVGYGTTMLNASYTLNDLTEGFVGEGGFVTDVTFQAGQIVVPEPAALALLGLLAVIRRR